MNNKKNLNIVRLVNELKKVIDEERILLNESMKKHSSFKIGGLCDLMLKPKSIDEIQNSLKILKKFDIPIMILGKGSNILVNDDGISACVIKLSTDFAGTNIEKNEITAESGISLKNLAEFAAKHSLSGLEFAHGIPGTLGGAVTMNAGAYGGEIKHIVKEVTVLDNALNIIKINSEDMEFGYRKSVVQSANYIVLGAKFKLNIKNKEEILTSMQDYMARRQAKQPLNYPSCGSVFKRPEGYFAGGLIEECGLKGLQYGGAMVSEKHAGFIINKDNASAREVMNLIEMIQKTVFDLKNVRLEREVRFI